MTEPTIESLQSTIADLQAKIKLLEDDKAKTSAMQQSFDDLKNKHQELLATNMKLIQMIPAAGEPAKQGPKPVDISQMSETERYDYLKTLAEAGIEKQKA